MSRRINLRPRDRFEIFKRDNFRCGYCGRTPPHVILHVDHILAVSDGGTNVWENLITACQECNSGKGATPLSVKPQSLVNIGEQEKQRLEQLREYNKWLAERAELNQQWFVEVSNAWIILDGEDPDKYIIAADRASTVRRFLKDLPAQEIIDALYITHGRIPDSESNRFFKFFCGVCWRKIKKDCQR